LLRQAGSSGRDIPMKEILELIDWEPLQQQLETSSAYTYNTIHIWNSVPGNKQSKLSKREHKNVLVPTTKSSTWKLILEIQTLQWKHRVQNVVLCKH
jgi:hypothetical protein